jgi:hypothetical protein
MSASTTEPQSILLVQLCSAVTLGLLFGSTGLASFAVVPSLIAAPISTWAKLSVFNGLIIRANKTMPPIFLTAGGSMGYLAYQAYRSTGVVFGARNLYAVGVLAMVVSLALQTKIVPKNTEMQQIILRGEGKEDDGAEGNRRLGDFSGKSWTRVALSLTAFVCALAGMTS